MTDDMTPISFDEFANRKPRAPKRKTTAPPIATTTDNPAQLAAAVVADSESLNNKSIEEIAEIGVRRMANVVLLGGAEFLPKSLTEATTAAKMWATIASSERARLASKGIPLDDDDPAQKMVKKALAQVREIRKDQQA